MNELNVGGSFQQAASKKALGILNKLLHETKWFGAGRVDWLPNVDPQLIGEHREFIDQCNVDVPKGVFEQLGELRLSCSADWDDSNS